MIFNVDIKPLNKSKTTLIYLPFRYLSISLLYLSIVTNLAMYNNSYDPTKPSLVWFGWTPIFNKLLLLFLEFI